MTETRDLRLHSWYEAYRDDDVEPAEAFSLSPPGDFLTFNLDEDKQNNHAPQKLSTPQATEPPRIYANPYQSSTLWLKFPNSIAVLPKENFQKRDVPVREASIRARENFKKM
jgi:hypothetical protein